MGMMELPSSSLPPLAMAGDEQRRVKFLCSFGGSILPRPLDGKLRYVGGETRIVGVPRDVSYEELMLRMRDLFDGAWSLKYQQPDEDLDALISVVNDDDVMNMMEEYDKLGTGGDGLTRLRIFLFSHPDHDSGASSSSPVGGVQFESSDERETERRYLDALNSAVDGGSMLDMRNFGRHHMEFPISPPSSARTHHPGAFGDPIDRISEEFVRQTPKQHSPHHPGYAESMVWLPQDGFWGDKAGFPGNLGHHHVVCEPRNRCDHCLMALRRARLTEGDFASFPDCLHIRDNAGLDRHHHHHPQHYGYPNEVHAQDRGRFVPQHQLNHHHLEDPRLLYGERFPHHHGNYYDLHMMPPGQGYIHPAAEARGESLSDYRVPDIRTHMPLSRVEDSGIHYRTDPALQRPHAPPPISNFGGTPFEESEVGIPSDVNRKNKVFPLNGPATFDNYHSGKSTNPESQSIIKESKRHFFPEIDRRRKDLPRLTYPLPNVGDSTVRNPESSRDVVNGFQFLDKSHQMSQLTMISPEKEQDMNLKPQKPEAADSKNMDSNKSSHLTPDFISSVSFINLEDADKGRETVQEKEAVAPMNELVDRLLLPDSEPMPPQEELDPEIEAEELVVSKIESTVEEEEALAKGLQTIRNSDLEEIRELGCGTYGSVYHGKWKGSDVAIKRIKASCFAGKPSERKRLIAEFWKEALILSSVHHPYVVSFYGVVRDGPDGSLATVTEFMVNGSLKQVLQKKDRTIDRRKRIIIAMEVAFGMEYLHGQNIVHFDLKCENLLVNMRDPHRPVCKIGDLGLSKVKQKTLVSGGLRGTLPWMAPELLSGKTNMVSEKIDVYSFGIVLWELLTGEEPYADMHSASIIGGIVNNTLRPTIPTWCDPEWKALMELCWSTDPADRPPFSEISQRLRKLAVTVNVK